MVLSTLVRRHGRSFVVHLLEPAINLCLYGDYVCLGKVEIESQCSWGKEDTKLSWNVYTLKAESTEKILATSFREKFFV